MNEWNKAIRKTRTLVSQSICSSWGSRQINKYFQVAVSAMKDNKVGEEDICTESES